MNQVGQSRAPAYNRGEVEPRCFSGHHLASFSFSIDEAISKQQ